MQSTIIDKLGVMWTSLKDRKGEIIRECLYILQNRTDSHFWDGLERKAKAGEQQS